MKEWALTAVAMILGVAIGYDRGESNGFDRGYDYAIDLAIEKGVVERSGPCLVWKSEK